MPRYCYASNKSSRTHLETRKLSDPPLDDVKTTVIDDGSSLSKAGFAGDEEPKGIFPCVVGKRKYFSGKSFMGVGELALAKPGVLKMTYPIGV